MTSHVADESALEILCKVAELNPDRPLMTFLDTKTTFTYSEFLAETLKWATAFNGAGVDADVVVATMIPSGADAYFAWLGVAWLRGIEIPINLDFRGPMLAHILNSSGARIVVCTAQYLDLFMAIAAETPHVQLVIVLDDFEAAAPRPWSTLARSDFFTEAAPLLPNRPPRASDIASVVYTSGTTGPSKGVMVTWRVLTRMNFFPDEIQGTDFVQYSPWPMFHITGKLGFVAAIGRRGSSVVRSRWQTELFWDDVRSSGATCVLFLGGIPYFLWDRPAQDGDADNPLRYVQMAPVIPEYREFETRFDVKIGTGYSSSEAGWITSQYHPLPNHKTVGRANPGYEIRLVDPEGRDVGIDQPGEALIRTAERGMQSLGYWNLPEATENAWVDGWFHSGDGLMRDADGYLYFVDRVKDSIRRRGENVSSMELEALVNRHPSIAESAAIAIPSSEVDDDIMIVAVPVEGATVCAAELWEFLGPITPRFMLPRYLRFVSQLPKTVSGRVRKVVLREAGVVAGTWDRKTAN